MTATKFYANRSNARRAAKAAGLDLDALEFFQDAQYGTTEQAWTWALKFAPVATVATAAATPVPAPAPKAPRYKLHNRKPKAPVAAVAPALPVAAPTPAAPKAAGKQAAAAPATSTPPAKVFEVYGKSSVLSPVALVHGYLDKLAEGGKAVVRKDALFDLSQMGVNRFTARTQYQRWAAKRAGK